MSQHERAGIEPGPLDAALSIHRLTKAFGRTVALSDVSLNVAAGSVHALLGENGSGKSTLIKTLSGYHVPDPGGHVAIAGNPLSFGSPASAHALGCRFVHQDLGLIDSLSVADNIALTIGYPSRLGSIRSRELDRRVTAALHRVGLDLDPRLPVGGLPAATRTGVALARALQDADQTVANLLVLDEPTATLPGNEVDALLAMVGVVAANGIGVLYVTHHIDEVFTIADVVSVLRDGRKVSTQATQTLTHRDIVNLLVGREFDELRSASDALPSERGEVFLDVRDLTTGTLRSVSFEVAQGEILGVAGITGSGREALLPTIFGATLPESGSVLLGGNSVAPGRPDHAIAAGVALLPAHRVRQSGVMTLPARENLTLPRLRDFWRPPFLRTRHESAHATTWFEKLDVRPRGATERPLATFSGGNQQKVLFAKWLRCSPQVLLLDEPTQGVDIGAKTEIHRQVVEAVATGVSAVVSSSDYDELAALCHRVIVLRAGRIVAELTDDSLTVADIAREALGTEGTSR